MKHKFRTIRPAGYTKRTKDLLLYFFFGFVLFPRVKYVSPLETTRIRDVRITFVGPSIHLL